MTLSDFQRVVESQAQDFAHKCRLKRYYLGRHDILGKHGRTNTDVNNKLVSNFCAYITNMSTGFFLGQPVTYKTTTEHESELQTLLDVFKYNDESAHNVELAEEASITGEAFEFLYLDGDARIRMACVPGEEVILICDATLEENILYGVRHFRVKNLDGVTDEEFVDIYDTNTVRHFTYNGALKMISEEPHYFGDVPIIPFPNNRQRRGDFEDVMTLVDAYNLAQSLTLDDLQDFTDAFLVLVGMGGTDPEDVRELRRNKVISLDGDGAKAEWLIKNINDTYVENVKTRLQTDIHKFSNIPDMSDESFVGNTSGVAIKYKLIGLEQIRSRKEREFKNALKDGFDLGDVFGLLGNIVTQLKDKLLALDGVGSLLAGGILMVGLRKLLNIGLRVKNVLGEITKLGATAAMTGAKATALPATAASSVGTMNVKAGVVNLSGAIKGATGGVGGAAQSTKAVTSLAAAQAAAAAATNKYQTVQASALAAQARAAQTRSIPDMAAARAAQATALAAKNEAAAANRRVTAIQNSQLAAQKYYTQREAAIVNNQLGSTAALNAGNEAAAQARAARIANMKSAASGGAALGALFGLMDVAAVRSSNQSRLADIDAEITEQKKILQDLRGNNETSQEQLNRQVEAIRTLESQRNDLIRQNTAAEFSAGAGAAGSIAGTALGAALGSLAGPMGTMIGGMVGGLVGQQLGEFLGNKRIANGFTEQSADVFGFNAPPQIELGNLQLGDSARRRESDAEEIARRPYENLAVLDSARRRAADEQERISLNQIDRFGKIDAQLVKWTGAPLFNRPAETATFDFYRDKATDLKPPEFSWPKLPEFDFGGLIDDLFGFRRAAAAELTPEQIAQQAAMERGETIQPAPAQPTEAPDLGAEGLTENLFSQLEGLGEGVGEIFSGLGTTIQDGFTSALDGVGETFNGLGETIQTGLTSALEGVGETFSTFGTTIQDGFTSALEGVGETFTGLGETIQTGLTSALEGVGETFSTFGTTIQDGFTSALDGVGETFFVLGETIQTGLTSALESVGTTFTGLGEIIGAGLMNAQATADASVASIKATFDGGLQAIQSAWAALPGFFGGVFGSLGGVASAAGSAIHAGLTSVIGAIIGAWQSAAATISGIISSIASMASSVGSMLPSIGGHYKGTASFAGGFTEINEHGGELMILPTGTKIYPHATTVELLRHEIQKRMREQDGLGDLGIGELTVPMPDRDDVQTAGLSAINFAPTAADDSLPMNLWRLMQNFFRDFDLPEINLPTDSLPVPRFNFPTADSEGNTTSNVDNSSQNVSINMGGVNINSGMDFEEFMHQMRNLITGAADNSIQF